MGCIRVDKITEYLCDPLQKTLKVSFLPPLWTRWSDWETASIRVAQGFRPEASDLMEARFTSLRVRQRAS